jgi:hypothetical protein
MSPPVYPLWTCPRGVALSSDCLKRYIAREVYQAPVFDLTADKPKQQSCTT